VIAARAPRSEPLRDRLLVVDVTQETLRDATVAELPSLLGEGDALVVNDAATLPASLRLTDGRELRLVGRTRDERTYRAVLFGEGDHRTPTERRPTPRLVHEGEALEFAGALAATVIAVDDVHPRLIELRFASQGAELYGKLYRAGKPIQYAHVPDRLALWDVQTRFSARPWAFETPSAGRPLTFRTVDALRKRGVAVAAITHSAGISSTGDEALDRRLPLPERYSIPHDAVTAVTNARRVIATGTTVVRALESAFMAHGSLRPCEGEATLVLGPGFIPSICDGILTGMHAPGTSHFALLEAFAPRELLGRALAHADRAGYLEHEFGDSMLLIADR